MTDYYEDDLPPYYEDAAEDCSHEEFDINWEGRAYCFRCQESWWASREQIEAQQRHEAEYAQWIEDQERPWTRFKQWLRSWWDFLPRFRLKPLASEDDIPF